MIVSHFLAVYMQVWCSQDGGRSFSLLQSVSSGNVADVQIREHLLVVRVSSGGVLVSRIPSPRLSQLSGTLLSKGVVSLTHNPKTDSLTTWSIERESSGQQEIHVSPVPHLSLLEVREFLDIIREENDDLLS